MTGDLFGHEPPTATVDGSVSLVLTLHRTGAKAWLLSLDHAPGGVRPTGGFPRRSS